MTANSERVILQVGDVVAIDLHVRGLCNHFTVTAESLDYWQFQVDAGRWRIVTKGGEK